jgi:hypothetical protein
MLRAPESADHPRHRLWLHAFFNEWSILPSGRLETAEEYWPHVMAFHTPRTHGRDV